MKGFWALPVALRLVLASHATFSVLEDILGFPQYEVGVMNTIITESEASSRIAALSVLRATAAASSSSSIGIPRGQASLHDNEKLQQAEEGVRDYEIMMLRSQRYLCSLPVVKLENVTAEPGPTPEEVEKELARATAHGEELLRGMQGNCIYFNTGWWTYSFCYNQTVSQFHAMPPGGQYPFYPPWADKKSPIYSLGSYTASDTTNGVSDKKKKTQKIGAGDGSLPKRVTDDVAKAKRDGSITETGLATLEQKGELKYLVQKLDGGTVCDLTGKPRKIEVQFHCMPDSIDRIAMIKELATCTYLMVIHTPRLCKDVAFHPPTKDKPNPIKCTAIIPDGANARDYPGLSFLFEDSDEYSSLPKPEDPVIVGDLELGANRIIVPSGPGAIAERKGDNAPLGGWLRDRPALADSLILGGQREKLIGTVAWSDKPPLSDEELVKLGLGKSKKEGIPGYIKQMKDVGKGKKWRIDAVDTARGKEFRGIIETVEGTEGYDEAKKEEEEQGKQEQKANEQGSENAHDGPKEGDSGSEGSQEQYYDEL